MTLRFISVFAILLLGACSLQPPVPAGVACRTEAFAVLDDYPGARRGACRVRGGRRVELEIQPEDEPPINDSAWYGFRIAPNAAGPAEIRLRYAGGNHRYVPKISYDGETWQPLPDGAVTFGRRANDATLTLNLDDRPVWVSAQALLLPPAYAAWMAAVAENSDARLSLLGLSAEGRPIELLDTGGARELLFMTGRQHPPEVSGAWTMFAFVETLLSDSELARRFRERFRIVAVPLMNPDGVVRGHWRNNVGGVDLNRDWGPFTQPETRLIRELLAGFDAEGSRPRVFLDFHSTSRNLFYTQDDNHVTNPPGFTEGWLTAAAARLPDYEFENRKSPVSDQPNGKNYMYRRYGIPTVTFETGDETPRDEAARAARVFAEELMRAMLAMP